MRSCTPKLYIFYSESLLRFKEIIQSSVFIVHIHSCNLFPPYLYHPVVPPLYTQRHCKKLRSIRFHSARLFTDYIYIFCLSLRLTFIPYFTWMFMPPFEYNRDNAKRCQVNQNWCYSCNPVSLNTGNRNCR